MKKPTWPEVCALAERHGVQHPGVAAVHPGLHFSARPDCQILARRLAMVQGLSRYHGNPCPRHSTTERFVCNAACVVCQAEYRRSEYHRNPDANKQRSAAWHRENRQYRNVYQQANRQKNREASA